VPETRRGVGVVFYDKHRGRVLVYRRDNTPTLPFPDHLDLLGGHLEPGETPEQTVVREMAEELEDRRTGAPYVLVGHRLFTVHTDAQGVVDYIFYKAVDFDLAEVRLLEGQALVWLTEDEARSAPLAFGYSQVLAAFFHALRAGMV